MLGRRNWVYLVRGGFGRGQSDRDGVCGAGFWGGRAAAIALTVAGGLAAVLTPTPEVAVADESSSALLRNGKHRSTRPACPTALYLQGVPDHGPSLMCRRGGRGHRPLLRGEDHAEHAIGAYVQANGGGPTVLRNPDGSIAMKSLRGDDLGRGGDLFRLNCSSCHNFTGKGRGAVVR